MIAPLADALLELGRLLRHVVLHQQVLGEGQQQAIGGLAQAGLQQGIEAILLGPEAAQDQEALRRLPPHPGQDRRIAGAHLEQQLLGGGPELGFTHDPQIERIGFVGVVLQHPGGRIGAVAGDHHRLVRVEQEGGGDVLAGQGREGDRIGPQAPEQVVGQG